MVHGSGVHVPDSTIDRIVDLYDEKGTSFADIGERFGMKADTVRRLYNRRKFGSPVNPANVKSAKNKDNP